MQQLYWNQTASAAFEYYSAVLQCEARPYRARPDASPAARTISNNHRDGGSVHINNNNDNSNNKDFRLTPYWIIRVIRLYYYYFVWTESFPEINKFRKFIFQTRQIK